MVSSVRSWERETMKADSARHRSGFGEGRLERRGEGSYEKET